MAVHLSRWLLPAAGIAAAAGLLVGPVVLARTAGPPPAPLVDTTLEDFFQPGTQPDATGLVLLPIVTPGGFAGQGQCVLCHGGFETADPPLNVEAEPFRNWAGSMKAQASRDPIFYACLTVANQDVGSGGDLCIRCHAPGAWLGGRSVPTDASGFTELVDFDGVTCHFCHRLVNPGFPVPPGGPPEDDPILMDLISQGLLPDQPGSGRYVIDPDDVRRGPFQLCPDPPNCDPDEIPHNPHFPVFFPPGVTPPIIQSPFHRMATLCGTCHDVSNPMFSLQGDGSYDLNALDAAHPTQDKYDMFPMERTFSEWSQSQFANGGVVFPDGRFGGALPDTTPIETCQDCHMPDQVGPGCRVPDFPIRSDEPQHAFNGGNTWVLLAVRSLYPDLDTGLTDAIVADSQARVTQMLQDASDMELEQQSDMLRVRVINLSGHKLPTGYIDGRRMWINVKFFDDIDQLIGEHGAYDVATADLTTANTKVYEAKAGLDADMAAATGMSEGESFHFILVNTYLKDNRIPPMGFTNAGFDAMQAAPVGYSYADFQNWDDTFYAIPVGAASAVVTLYYQTTSKEYIEFLLNENVTDTRGQIAHDQWVLHGKSAPVDMDCQMIVLSPPCPQDINGDGTVNVLDLVDLLLCFGQPAIPGCEAEDINGDGMVNVLDLIDLLLVFGAACP